MVVRSRLSSVPPSMGSTRGFVRSSSITPSYRPRYAATPGNYFLGGAGGAGSVSTTSRVRASSVAPSSSVSLRVSSISPSVGIRASSVTPLRARASSLAPASTLAKTSTIKSTSMLPPIYPSRKFGSRLGTGYTSVSQKPAIYDEYYAASYIPSGGRDSWTAYRVADEALDDNDQITYDSKKKDFEVMKDINRKIPFGSRMKNRLHQLGLLARYGSTFSLPAPSGCRQMSILPPRSAPISSPAPRRFPSIQKSSVVQTVGRIQGYTDWPAPRVIRRAIPSAESRLVNAKINAKVRATSVPPLSRPPPRAGSVTPVTRKFVPAPVPRVVKAPSSVQVNRMVKQRVPVTEAMPGAYRVPPPKVQVRYSTVERGSDLLNPKYRVWSREQVDLECPRTMLDMKMRLAGAKDLMEKHRAMISKHGGGGDAEMNAIDSELRAIKASQVSRKVQSVSEYKVSRDKKLSADLRRRLRGTVLRSRLGSVA